MVFNLLCVVSLSGSSVFAPGNCSALVSSVGSSRLSSRDPILGLGYSSGGSCGSAPSYKAPDYSSGSGRGYGPLYLVSPREPPF